MEERTSLVEGEASGSRATSVVYGSLRSLCARIYGCHQRYRSDRLRSHQSTHSPEIPGFLVALHTLRDVNRWLKLALSSLAIGVVAISGFITMPATPAVANEEAASETAAPTIIHGARNSSLWVGADANGALYWSEDQGTTWASANFGLT